MKHLTLLAVAFGIGFLFYAAATGSGPWAPSSVQAEEQSAPTWRTVWIGSDRYLQTDAGWHAWSPDSKWVRLHPHIAERLGLK
jgi:hypothetical protein